MPEFRISSLRFNYLGNWETGTTYSKDAVVTYQGNTYVCQVPHNSSDFNTDLNHNVIISGSNYTYWSLLLTGSLWKNQWQADTYYFANNIVLYHGALYKCTEQHTSTSGFDNSKFTTLAIFASWNNVWQINTVYGVGDVVKYGGVVYTCTQNHASASTAEDGLESDLGNWEVVTVGIEYAGAWAEGVRYKFNDVIKVGGNLYACTNYHTSSDTFDPANFNLYLPGEEYVNLWSESVEYQVGDSVIYGGYTYTSNTPNNINNVPSVDSVSWDLLQENYKIEGNWSDSTSYRVGAVVARGGHAFVAIKDNHIQDPAQYSISKSYVASGSSGTTLVVNSTSSISIGAVITGTGFTRGQSVVSIDDSQTLTISEAPDSALTDGQSITFVGVNYEFWEFLAPGVVWNGYWQIDTEFLPSNLVIWKSATYRCIQKHTSSSVIRPDLDTTNTYWVIYALHARQNALTTVGDILTYANNAPVALPIGTNNYLLKVTDGELSYQTMMVTPNVFYVATNGVDSAEFGWGETWDRPWRTIKYACQTLSAGRIYQNAAALLTANKEWLTTEMYNFMVYSVANEINGYTSDYVINQELAVRDASYIIDALAYDITRGGNSQTVAAALAYFYQGSTDTFYSEEVAADVPFFIPAITYLASLIDNAFEQIAPVDNFQSLNGIPSGEQVTQSLAPTPEAGSIDIIDNLLSIVINALTDESTANVPTSNSGLTATIFVKTGTYEEVLPISIPENVALVGDELRGVVVAPATSLTSVITEITENNLVMPSTVGLTHNMPVQFAGTVFGGVEVGPTYYVIGSSISSYEFMISETPSGSPMTLSDGVGNMTIIAGDSVKDMFYMRNGSGLRNMTLSGLLGTLTEFNEFLTKRPTGGSYVSLDPGAGVNDTSVWIVRKSPYVQNVSTFGNGCVGLKIDGTLHAGGNKSIVCNDFTQILSDGIGIWCTGSGSLCEAVSVFSYYGYAGYFSENGGRIRATNGNSSYGTYGCIAEGFDDTEIPATGIVYNRNTQAAASPISAFGNTSSIAKVQYSNAGSEYNTPTTNLLKYSNSFLSTWTNDGTVALAINATSPFNYVDAWSFTGSSSSADTGYLYQNINITPPGGTYINVASVNDSGSGFGATFNITIRNDSYEVTVNAHGSGYVKGNQLRIYGSTFGGIDGVNDLVITVASLVGSTIDTITTTGTVPAGSNQHYTLSVYAKKGTSTSFDLYAFFSGSSTKGSYVNYNFDTNTVTPHTNGDGGAVPAHYGANYVGNGWYRVWFAVADVTAANTSLQYRIYSKPRNGTAGMTHFYGTQLEASSTLYSPSFYLETSTKQHTAYANYKVFGAGSGVEVVGNETRSRAVFQTRVGPSDFGTGYVTSSNQSQGGSPYYLILAQSDVNPASKYQNMRVFINTGTGVGQYGIIAYYIPENKYAYVIKESFELANITHSEATTNLLTLGSSVDVSQVYVGQPIRFVPSYFRNVVTSISEATVTASATLGGQINTMTVSSTRALYVNMPVTFSGSVFGGVITDFTYYITAILDSNTIQLSTLESGTTLFLTNSAGFMTLHYPTRSGHFTTSSSTANMAVNQGVTFTGNTFGGLSLSTTYYVNQVIDDHTFTISNSLVTINASATSATTNQVAADITTTLVPTTPITFSGTSFGGVTAGNVYYINNVIDPTHFTLSNTLITTTAYASELISNLITVDSTSGFIVGNPVRFSGTAFGGIESDHTYYVLNVNNSTSFTVTDTYALVTVSVTGTTISTDPTRPNQLTANSTVSLVPLNPIKISGTSFGGLLAGDYYISKIVDTGHFTVSASMISTIATATAETSNLITVTSTAGFVANNPITFTGVSFGNINTEQIYYILAVNDGVSFTVSETVGGSAVELTSGTGTFTVKTTASDYVITSTATGTMSGYTTAAASAVTVSTDTGSLVTNTTSTNTVLTTSSGTLVGTSTSSKIVPVSSSGSMNAQFATAIFGGVSAAVQYYVLSISPGVSNKITVTDSVGGVTPVTLVTASGNMQFGAAGWDHVNPGSPAIEVLDSTTTYYVEPRVLYDAPSFSQTAVTLPALASGAQYNNIAAGNGCFVAIGNSGFIIGRSTDGHTWSSYTLPVTTSVNWTSIAYGSNYWVMVGTGSSTSLYSNSNGLSWKSSILPTVTTWTNVAYGNGKFVAIAQGTTNSAYSTDNGKTWTSGSGLPNAPWVGLVYGGDKFVAVASGTATAAYSTDGITWTSITLPAPSTWSSLTYGGGKFVAVSSTSAKPTYSFDGITWVLSPYSIIATSVAYGQGVFVTTNSASTTSYVSEDAYNWIPHTVSNDTYGNIAFGFAADTNIGTFVTVSKQSTGSNILAGCRAKSRVAIATGVVSSITTWEPGSNYTSVPSVELIDFNATNYPELTARVANGALSSPTFINNGTGYINNNTVITVWGNGYADEVPKNLTLVANDITKQPSVGSNLYIAGDDTIYKITSITDLNGTLAPNLLASIQVSPSLNSAPETGTEITIRANYSQVRLTGHDFLYIGEGNYADTAYPVVDPNNAAIQNQVLEHNSGRVFYTSTDQDGNFKVGNLFGVQQATGIVTISASQFGLSGLQTLSLGGIAVGGSSVVISQFSTDPTFIANSDNILPTQKAIKSYLGGRLSQGGSNGVTGNITAGSISIGNPNTLLNIVPEGISGSAINMKNKVMLNGNGGYNQADGDMMAYDFFIKNGSRRSNF